MEYQYKVNLPFKPPKKTGSSEALYTAPVPFDGGGSESRGAP